MSRERYDRQVSAAAIGAAGQARIRDAAVTIEGAGFDAEICARYLIGAGVGEVVVHQDLQAHLRGLNEDVVVTFHEGPDGPCSVSGPSGRFQSPIEDPVARGADVARACLLTLAAGGT